MPKNIEEVPETMPDEELLYELADLFKVFGDTTRIKILYALMGRDLCVAELADIIGATQSAVSHQLRTLKQARLVKFQRDGKKRHLFAVRRPCVHHARPGHDAHLRMSNRAPSRPTTPEPFWRPIRDARFIQPIALIRKEPS